MTAKITPPLPLPMYGEGMKGRGHVEGVCVAYLKRNCAKDRLKLKESQYGSKT